MNEQGGPASTNQSDPFLLWRQFCEANEQLLAGLARQVTGAHRLSDAEAKVLELYVALQRMTREALGAQLNTLNLPTRDDLERLCELVSGVEKKMSDLDLRLARLERRVTRPKASTSRAQAAAATATRPKRRPPASAAKRPRGRHTVARRGAPD